MSYISGSGTGGGGGGATTEWSFLTVNTTPYAVQATDQFLSVDTTASSIVLNLPATPSTGKFYMIKDASGTAGTNSIIVTTAAGVITI